MKKMKKVKRGQGQGGEETETTPTTGFSRLDSKGLGDERSEQSNNNDDDVSFNSVMHTYHSIV